VVESPGWGRRLGWGRGRYGARWDGLGAHFGEREIVVVNGNVGNFGSALAAVFTGGLSEVTKAAAAHPSHLEWVRRYGPRYYEHPEWRRLYWREHVEPGRGREIGRERHELGRERRILGHERHEERELGRERRILGHERHEERELGRERHELARERRGVRGVDSTAGAPLSLPPASLGAVDPLCPTNACGLPPAGNYAPSALAGIGGAGAGLSAVSRSMRGDGLN
jgi:hypothetical protein